MKAVNIKWDTDKDLNLLMKLPSELEIPENIENDDDISDWLSDITGFCHFGFDIKNKRDA